MVLIDYARKAHQVVEAGFTTRQPPLMALVLTATAGEAAVNFMLEPLLTPNEWKAIERKGPERKWTRLSKELQLAPPLEKPSEPLAGFLRTLDARHHVVHFQHGKNVQRLESPAVSLVSGRSFVPISAMRATTPASAEDALRAENALTYYPSLEKLLRVVLPAYAKREEGFALYFECALTGKVTEQ